MRNKILSAINARISIPTWMLALSSAGIAYIAAFLLWFGPGLQEFGEGLPLTGDIWVPLLMLGTTATVVGLAIPKDVHVLRWGSLLSFMMWVFGGIAFTVSGQGITTVIVVLPWLIFYAYLYLASFFRDEMGF